MIGTAAWRSVAIACVMWLLAAECLAQPGGFGSSQAPHATPQLRDPDFGVATDAAGLRRRVAMLQWQPAADGFALVWDDAGAAKQLQARGYGNPKPRLQPRTWHAQQILLDGRPLAPAVVRELGRWRAFRPSFTSLPRRQVARYQPEGDGLGTAENPLAPQVGDLRVTWEAFHLPPLAGKLVLRDGIWQLRRDAARERVRQPVAESLTPWALSPRAVGLLGATVLAALILARVLRRRH